MSLSSPVSTQTKKEAITRLVKPEILRQPTAWGAQMKLLNSLVVEYQSDQFWKHFDPGFQVNNLAFFKTMDGAEVLKNAYNVFHFQFPVEKVVDTNLELVYDDSSSIPAPSIESRPHTMAEYLNSNKHG